MPLLSKTAWFLNDWGILRPFDDPAYSDQATTVETEVVEEGGGENIFLSDEDEGFGTDTETIERSYELLPEVALGVESETLVVELLASDTGAGSDNQIVEEGFGFLSVPLEDSATASESQTLSALLSSIDSAVGLQDEFVGALLSDADVALAFDEELIEALVSSLDSILVASFIENMTKGILSEKDRETRLLPELLHQMGQEMRLIPGMQTPATAPVMSLTETDDDRMEPY